MMDGDLAAMMVVVDGVDDDVLSILQLHKHSARQLIRFLKMEIDFKIYHNRSIPQRRIHTPKSKLR